MPGVPHCGSMGLLRAFADPPAAKARRRPVAGPTASHGAADRDHRASSARPRRQSEQDHATILSWAVGFPIFCVIAKPFGGVPFIGGQFGPILRRRCRLVVVRVPTERATTRELPRLAFPRSTFRPSPVCPNRIRSLWREFRWQLAPRRPRARSGAATPALGGAAPWSRASETTWALASAASAAVEITGIRMCRQVRATRPTKANLAAVARGPYPKPKPIFISLSLPPQGQAFGRFVPPTFVYRAATKG